MEIVIRGPAAVGKSTLARHLAEYLKDMGHDVNISSTVDGGHSNFAVLPMRKITISEQWTRSR